MSFLNIQECLFINRCVQLQRFSSSIHLASFYKSSACALAFDTFFEKITKLGLAYVQDAGEIVFTGPIHYLDAAILTKFCVQLGLKHSLYEITASTNQIIKWHESDVCLAEWQSNGYGRTNKQWRAPYAQSVLLSCKRVFSTASISPMPISLRIGLALSLALSERFPGLYVQVKWPNDLYLNGSKLGGVLVERSIQAEKATEIVGVGLNVNTALFESNNTAKVKCVSLMQALSSAQDRTSLSELVVKTIVDIWSCKDPITAPEFCTIFNKQHCFHGRNVTFSVGDCTRQGRVIGLHTNGLLAIDCGDGVEYFSDSHIHSLTLTD